jgi:hypothetical protein
MKSPASSLSWLTSNELLGLRPTSRVVPSCDEVDLGVVAVARHVHRRVDLAGDVEPDARVHVVGEGLLAIFTPILGMLWRRRNLLAHLLELLAQLADLLLLALEPLHQLVDAIFRADWTGESCKRRERERTGKRDAGHRIHSR